jgi:hypothetical protein
MSAMPRLSRLFIAFFPSVGIAETRQADGPRGKR